LPTDSTSQSIKQLSSDANTKAGMRYYFVRRKHFVS
jgi:hypothetical protein